MIFQSSLVNKVVIPAILAVTISIAGIFAFMPIDMASTVHTTLQSSTAATTAHDLVQTLISSTSQTNIIQNSQFNNVNSTFDTDLKTNATATCTSGDFLVYWTFTNDTALNTGVTTALGIADGGDSDPADIVITLTPINQTSISGIIGGNATETITFYGNSTGPTIGTNTFEDTGDLLLVVQCQSTATTRLVP